MSNFLAVQLFILALVSTSQFVQANKIALNSPCTKSDQCGTHTVCSVTSKHCKCFYGHTPESDGLNCLPFPCAQDSDCVTKYGEHSICNTESVLNAVQPCQCDLISGWTFNMETLNSCIPERVLLNNATCQAKNDCGTLAFCDSKGDQKCKCMLGYKPELKGGIHCEPIICKVDSDCTKWNLYAQCFHGTCLCLAQSGYKHDKETERCVPRSQFIGHNCTSRESCSIGAFCDFPTNITTTSTNNNGICKCSFGHIQAPNQMDCTELHCASDKQCEQLNSNSKCFESTSCICGHSYKLDLNRHVCVYSLSSGSEAWPNCCLIYFVLIFAQSFVFFPTIE